MTQFALLAALLAIAGCLLVGLSAPAAVRRLPPGQAVVLLSSASFVLSLACGVALSAIAIAVLATIAAVATDGGWSAALLQAQFPMPGWLGGSAAVVVLFLLGRAAMRTMRIWMALVRADRLSRSLRAPGGPVVVVDDGTADAYTVAGIHGCVVISRRLLDHLDADQRRVVTAHELSHLRRRHHLYVHLADVAAAGNPLLRAVPAQVRSGVERWADEDAAAGVGDRRLVGRALARVALLRAALGASPAGRTALMRLPSSALRLGINASGTAARVQALLCPPPPRRTAQVAIAVVLCFVVLGNGLVSLDHIQDAIESASGHRPSG